MDGYSLNAAEYAVEKKCDGAYFWKRLGMKIFTWVPGIVATLVFMILSIPAWVIMIPVYPLVWMKLLKPLLYPYVYIEYEYQIMADTMQFSNIYGKCKRKQVLELTISEMLAIAPYSGDTKAAADAPDIKSRMEFVSSMNAEDIYYLIYEKDGEKKLVFFEPTNKALKLLRLHNKNTVVTQVRV